MQSNLKRHLKSHGYDEIEERESSQRMRKRTGSHRIKHLRPFQSCVGLSPYRRLDQHLKKFHRLTPDEDVYR